MSDILDNLDNLLNGDDNRDQAKPSNMAQNGNQLPKEGPIAPSASAGTTTQQQQQQQSTQQPTTTQQQQQQPSPDPPSSSTTTTSQDPPPSSSSVDVPSSSSVAPPSSSSTVPPTSSAAPPSTLSSSTTTQQSTRTVVVVASGAASAPGLLSISSQASASSAADKNSKGGVGGSGLPLGAIVGIVIGGLVVIAIIAILATRSIRKRARSRRTAHRSSMFEPWPAPVALEDEPYEKPAQSYPMQDTSTDYNDGTYPAYTDGGSYPPMAGYDQYGAAPQPYGQAPYVAGAAGMGAGAAAVGAAAVASGPGAEAGLQDNMMVRVKVGFVRSLEDELAVTSGQQLYLHTSYDDGWCLCEDQAQNRGVVPISCLEPWDEGVSQSLAPSTSDPALTNMSARRSSLYQVSPAPTYD